MTIIPERRASGSDSASVLAVPCIHCFAGMALDERSPLPLPLLIGDDLVRHVVDHHRAFEICDRR